MNEWMGISIDLSKDKLFDELGLKRLKESYMMDGETSPQQRYAHVSNAFSSNTDHAQRLYNYASSHWLSYATPELAYGRNKSGLPISCFLTYLPDTSRGLIDTLSEVNTLSMLGGGVGIHMDIRSPDDKSTGILPHLKTYDASALAYKQGSTRRGSYAAYLDISHPEIIPFIEMRKATGDPNIRCANLNHGVNITDDFMMIIENCMLDPNYDDSWDLIDPHSKKVISTVSAKHLWQLLIETRHQRGEPYLHFIDTANEALMPFQKELGLKINGSNLCFSGDTLVAVADGRTTISIKDLADESNGVVKFPVYSARWDSALGIWISEIKDAIAFKSGTQQLLEISLSDGSSFRCTAEHKIALLSGGYIEARSSLGVELQPFNTNTLYTSTAVISVSKSIVEDVYDLTVDDNHNFNIITKHDNTSSSGILVHNCQEIELCTNEERTAVCCLASLNLDYYDTWKDDHQFYRDVAEMLDNVLETFITTAPPELYRAINSASKERAIGIGVMGFHSYLQQKNIPLECAMAKSMNINIFSNIKKHLDLVNRELATDRGECPDAIGHGKRFSYTMAVAPNASSSIIMGNTSPGIEPFRANAYRQDTLSGFSIYKNKWLNNLLKSKQLTTKQLNDIWKDIIAHDGSVQHLTILDSDEKLIFKTALEIDQRWVIDLAADRAPLIDQGQSVNVFVRPDAHIKYLHAIHFSAWKKGLKGLYYLRSEKLNKTDKISQQIHRNIIEEIDLSAIIDDSECLACQG